MYVCTEPSAATGLGATASSDQLVVTWTAPSGEVVTGYTVELKDVANSQKPVTATTATFDHLSPGKKYTVVIVSKIDSLSGGTVEKDFYTSKSLSLLIPLKTMHGAGYVDITVTQVYKCQTMYSSQ